MRIVHGFTTQLPGRSRRFFQRQYYANYPRPFQAGPGAPFPRTVEIARFQMPLQQSLVIRKVSFSALMHSGVGIEDLAEVPRGRSIGTLGFQIIVGNRGMVDFQTNLPGTGVPVLYSPTQGPNATAPRAGQGSTYQGVGTITPNESGDIFASYAMPSDDVIANAIVFQPPSFDLRLFEVKMEGWLAPQAELEKIIDSLSR